MNTKEQILALISHYSGGNKTQFGRLLGLSNQAIQGWLSRESFDKDLCYQKLPGLSASWLLSGEGSMLNVAKKEEDCNLPSMPSVHDRIDYLVKNYADGNNTRFAAIVDSDEGSIRGYKKAVLPKQDFLEKCVTKLGISPEWLLTGQGKVQLERPAQVSAHLLSEMNPRDVTHGSKLMPFYDVDFFGGFPDVFNDQTTHPDDWVVSPGFERATLWCRCHGRSMEPLICNGDLIALREVTVEDIQYGNVYAVVLDGLRTIKVLRRSATPASTLLFVPINRTDFDEQEFPIDRIQQIYEVIGCTHYLGQ